MYKKDLTRSVHLRITEEEMQGLIKVSTDTKVSICELIRVGVDAVLQGFKFADEMIERTKGVKCDDADTKTNIDN